VALALPFLLALLVSATLVPICRSLALRLGYVVEPIDRPSPTKVKARFGGAAIAFTLFICATALGAFTAAPVLLLCSGALLLVGITGEVIRLKPSTKLAVLIGIASVFLVFDYRLYWAESAVVDSVITVFWIVGVTSAFNLLDNMDGLCGGIALIAGTSFLSTRAARSSSKHNISRSCSAPLPGF
jgi:UDP-GlcNAc:undecaprenyl-phosphate GlcNAc-1-phosphate transferase